MPGQRSAPAYHASVPSIDEVAQDEMAKLPTHEAAVLRLRFGLEQRTHTVAEVAAALGLSIGAVRRLQARALVRLRWRGLT